MNYYLPPFAFNENKTSFALRIVGNVLHFAGVLFSLYSIKVFNIKWGKQGHLMMRFMAVLCIFIAQVTSVIAFNAFTRTSLEDLITRGVSITVCLLALSFTSQLGLFRYELILLILPGTWRYSILKSASICAWTLFLLTVVVCWVGLMSVWISDDTLLSIYSVCVVFNTTLQQILNFKLISQSVQGAASTSGAPVKTRRWMCWTRLWNIASSLLHFTHPRTRNRIEVKRVLYTLMALILTVDCAALCAYILGWLLVAKEDSELKNMVAYVANCFVIYHILFCLHLVEKFHRDMTQKKPADKKPFIIVEMRSHSSTPSEQPMAVNTQATTFSALF